MKLWSLQREVSICESLMLLTNKKLFLQLLRYCIVGLGSNFVMYVGYLLLSGYVGRPKWAMTIIYVVGIAFGFFANSRWTFSRNELTVHFFGKYLFAQLLGYCLNWILLYIFVDKYGYSDALVQAFAILVVAAFLFLLCKFFVFKSLTYGEREHL